MELQQITVLQNKKGVTLVEVMISLVILLFVSLAMMQTAVLSISVNMRNALRDEAVSVAEMRMNQVRGIPFASLTDDATALPVGSDCPATFANGIRIQRDVRNITKDFCTNVDVTSLSTNTQQIQVRVSWRWNGEDFVHSMMTILRQQT